MADIIESYNRRGQNITLQDAYKKACLMNDTVRSVLSQRVKAKGAQQTPRLRRRRDRLPCRFLAPLQWAH